MSSSGNKKPKTSPSNKKVNHDDDRKSAPSVPVCFMARLPDTILPIIASFMTMITYGDYVQTFTPYGAVFNTLKWTVELNPRHINRAWNRALKHMTPHLVCDGIKFDLETDVGPLIHLPRTHRVFHIDLQVDSAWGTLVRWLYTPTRVIHPHVTRLSMTPLIWIQLIHSHVFSTQRLRLLFPQLQDICVSFENAREPLRTIAGTLGIYYDKCDGEPWLPRNAEPVSIVNRLPSLSPPSSDDNDDVSSLHLPSTTLLNINGQPLQHCSECHTECIPYALCQNRYCPVYVSDKPLCTQCDQTTHGLTFVPLTQSETVELQSYVDSYGESYEENTLYLNRADRPPRVIVVADPLDDSTADEEAKKTDTGPPPYHVMLLPSQTSYLFLHRTCMHRGVCEGAGCRVQHSPFVFRQCYRRKCGRARVCFAHTHYCLSEQSPDECKNVCCPECIKISDTNDPICPDCRIKELKDDSDSD